MSIKNMIAVILPEALDNMAAADAAFSGRKYSSLSRGERERYRERSALMLESVLPSVLILALEDQFISTSKTGERISSKNGYRNSDGEVPNAFDCQFLGWDWNIRRKEDMNGTTYVTTLYGHVSGKQFPAIIKPNSLYISSSSIEKLMEVVIAEGIEMFTAKAVRQNRKVK